MGMPEQVRKQLEEVEAIEKTIQEPTPVTGTPEVVDTPPTTDTDAIATPPEQVVTPPVTEPNLQSELDVWKQRYSTLQGMYDADVKRVHTQNTKLMRENAELKATVAKQAETVQETRNASSVTDKDKEQFGEDLIDLQRRVVSETVGPLTAEIATLKAENAKLLEQLGRTGSEIASLSFGQKLSIAVPDFESVNADPRWSEWLNAVDPMLRAPRRTVAQAAFDRGDVEAVKGYVDMWKSTLPATTSKANLQKELQSQVVPPKNSNSVPEVDPRLKTYTTAEADRLWRRVAELGRQGKTEEANKLDAELTAAYTSGRVVG